MVLVMVRKITRMVVGFDLNLTSTSTIMASRLRTVPTTARTLDRTPPKRKWLSGNIVRLQASNLGGNVNTAYFSSRGRLPTCLIPYLSVVGPSPSYTGLAKASYQFIDIQVFITSSPLKLFKIKEAYTSIEINEIQFYLFTHLRKLSYGRAPALFISVSTLYKASMSISNTTPTPT